MNWRGTWDSSVTYALQDVVFYGGSSYACISVNTDVPPTSSNIGTYWDLFAAQGPAVTGPKGDQGVPGVTSFVIGPRGPAGASGNTGPQGLPGVGSPGSQGPRGYPGQTGPAGPTGATGSPGATGQGFTWRNAWNNSVTYVAYDCVSYIGNTYVCVANSVQNVIPGSDSSKWNIMVDNSGTATTQVNSDWNATSGVAEILNKPTIPTVPTLISAFTNNVGYLTTQVNADWNATSGTAAYILNKPTIPTQVVTSVAGRSGAVNLTPTDVAGLATVASSGAYADLSGKPTLVSTFTNDAGYLTSSSTISVGKVTGLASVATSGSYADLTSKPALGSAAALNVGTTAGTVAAGNDPRFITYSMAFAIAMR